MKDRVTIVAQVIMVLVMYACVEPYEFTSTNNAKIPVIEGRVADTPGESFVKLQWSSNVNDFHDSTISGANVYIMENNDIKIPFNMVGNGYYKPDDDFKGSIGSNYQLYVQIGENQYTSKTTTILPSQAMDSLAFQSVIDQRNGYIAGEPYLNITLFAKSESNAAAHYTYAAEETWLVKTKRFVEESYKLNQFTERVDTFEFVYASYSCNGTYLDFRVLARQEWIKNKKVPNNAYSCFGELTIFREDFEDPPEIVKLQNYWIDTIYNSLPRYCWGSRNFTNYNLVSTQSLLNSADLEIPVHKAKLDYRFLENYSVLIKQYSLPPNAFTYLQTLKNFVSSGVSLNQYQPGYLYGNISNENNTSEKVIGFFYGTSVLQKRIFISNLDLDTKARSIVNNGADMDCLDAFCLVPVIDTNTKFMTDLKESDSVEYQYRLDQRFLLRNEYLEHLQDSLNIGNRVIVNVLRSEDLGLGIVDAFMLTTGFCVDCRFFGTSKKPDFWPDNYAD